MLRRSIVAVLLVLALVATACGGQNVAEDPRQSLQDAFERMAEWEGAEFTLRLDTDVESLLAADDTGEMTEEQAQAVVDGRVVVRSYAGPDLADTSDDEFEMEVATGDTVAFHLIAFQTEAFYVRSQVRELIDRFGDADAQADLNEMANEASQVGIDFADDFFGGAWLQLQGVQQLSNMYSGMAGIETPEPSELETLREELEASIEGFLAEVEVEYVGPEDPGEHVRVVATAKQFVELSIEFFEQMSGMLPTQPGMAPEDLVGEMRRELENTPDVEVPIEFWLDGGTVSRMGFDLVGFAERNPDLDEDMEIPEGLDRLLIVADIAEFGGGLEAPDDAIEVDLFELFGRFMGQGFGAGGFESVTESATETVTSEP
ncbi:MAG: hypothetical protein R3343_10805 [Nitriliruptorales bacterium]|nr:hypothetical protein [Nitriliruptorales bacterium]